jgi:hypothetical protein
MADATRERVSVERLSVRVIVSWLVVLIPLAWGVYETFKRVMALFQ